MARMVVEQRQALYQPEKGGPVLSRQCRETVQEGRGKAASGPAS